jgi:hypothetical protein
MKIILIPLVVAMIILLDNINCLNLDPNYSNVKVMLTLKPKEVKILNSFQTLLSSFMKNNAEKRAQMNQKFNLKTS